MRNICREVSSWIEKDTDDNSESTATRAAPAGGMSHYITGVAGGYGAAAAGKTLILKEGTTEIARWYVHNSLAIEFVSPVKLSAGAAANLVLAASGTGGVSGTAVLKGYTA